MKKILAFCFFPAFVPPTNGGQSRLLHFYKALSQWHQITLLTSTHIGAEEEIINHGLGLVERRIPKDDYFVRQYALLDEHSGGGDLSGPAIAACGRFPTRLHLAYLEEYVKADAVFHDFPFTVEYDLFAGIDNKPRFYNAHNCETILYQQLHVGARSRLIHEIVKTSEERMLELADIVLYCNEGDVAEFRDIAPKATFDVLYVPNGMTPTALHIHNTVSSDQRFRAVFMGSGHPPNARAAEFILRDLAPSFPDITFNLIGSCLPAGRYLSNVRSYGVVDDETKRELLSRADIALNPMSEGSGSNVKVLEYFSYGLPVISTPFGMRGIQAEADREYIEAPLEQFSQAIHHAANRRDSLRGIGLAGMALALDKYTWERIAQPVADYLEVMTTTKTNTNTLENKFVLALNDYDSFNNIGGGGTRTRGLYAAVSEWSPVVFLSFSDDGTLMTRKFAEAITVITVPKSPDHTADLAHINSQFHISANDIIASRHCATNPFLNGIYRVLRQSARSIVIEHCYMVSLPLAWGDRFLYSSQNHEAALKNRLLEWHPLKYVLLPELEHIERLSVECSAATIVVSHEDAASLIKGKDTSGPVIVVPNGAGTPDTGEAVDRMRENLRDKIGEPAVVFLGSAHMPNIEAAQIIIDRLAPQLKNVQFHLLGSVCKAITKFPFNVHLWGVVDDVTKSAVMQSCVLAINPMVSGSGSNVKLADFLGNGLFVVTTEFGKRGYPESINQHLTVACIDQFAMAIRSAFEQPEHFSKTAISLRRELFARELSMQGIAKRFVETLQCLERKKKRILYVVYRYTAPALGGAEVNIEKFVAALGHSNQFDIDVVAPEISAIHNHMRFSESYDFDPELGVPVDIPNVRFARFPVDRPERRFIDDCLKKAWRTQPRFEKVVNQQLTVRYRANGLTWGWNYPEGEANSAARWASPECGIFLTEPAGVQIEAYAPKPVMITVFSNHQTIAGPWSKEGKFNISFQAEAGDIEFQASAHLELSDPRPLGFRVTRFSLDGTPLDLSASTLIQRYLPTLPAESAFQILDLAAEETRLAQGLRLTDGRGPWSTALERYIAEHVSDYDLVVTHNNVFKPAVFAIEEAKKHGVPSILIPHAHMDDDFYHFPDWLESARNASLVLAVPKAACDFLEKKGCNVRYLPAGCDTSEQFTPDDQEAFRQAYPSIRPFVLVLGRKAGAKGYRQIIDAVEQLNRDGVDLQTVLIGPDDDGFPVDSPNAVYLGRQPRNVVRGALLSCLALCNMSSSESFGIVLLEAWLANKPVIANKNCAAFRDMAVDGVNAMVVNSEDLVQAIHDITMSPARASDFAANGKETTLQYSWSRVCNSFIELCTEFAT